MVASLLLVDLAAAAALFLAAGYALTTRELARWAVWSAALPLACAALLVVYVLGEDDYRGGGISRWDAYTSAGGGLAAMFVLSVGVLLVGAVLLAWASRRDRGLYAFTSIVLGIATLVLVVPATVGFSVN